MPGPSEMAVVVGARMAAEAAARRRRARAEVEPIEPPAVEIAPSDPVRAEQISIARADAGRRYLSSLGMRIDPERGAYRRRAIDEGAERRLYPDRSVEVALTEPIDASPVGKLQGPWAPESFEAQRNAPANNIASVLPEGLDTAFLDAHRRLGGLDRPLIEPARHLTNRNIEAVQTFGERAADALPLGFGDEIASLAVAPFTERPNYRQEYLQERANRSARNRGASIAGTITGSLPAAFMLAGGGPASGVGATGEAVPLGTRVLNSLRGAAIEGLRGGAIGGVTGAGLTESDNLQDRARGGLVGAAFGAPLGAAGRLVGDAAGALANYATSPIETARRAVNAFSEIGEGSGVAQSVRRFLSPENAYQIRGLAGEAPSNVIPIEGPALRRAALEGERSFANLGTPLDEISEPLANDLTQMARQFSDIETGVGGFQSLKNERLAQAFQVEPPSPSWIENVSNQISVMRGQLSNIEQRAVSTPRVARNVQEALYSLDEADRAISGTASLNTAHVTGRLSQEVERISPIAQRLLGSRLFDTRATNTLMNEIDELQRGLSSSNQYSRPSSLAQLGRSVDRIERQIRQLRNTPELSARAEEQLVALTGAVGRMRSSLTPELTQAAASPAEIYDLINKANMSIGRATSAETGALNSMGMQHTTAFQQPLERIYGSTRNFLRNPSVWGRQAVNVQSQMNDVVAPLLRTGRAASNRLGNLFVDSGEEAASGFRSYAEANPSAIRGIVNRAADPAYEGERQLLRDWITGYSRHGESLANLSDSPQNQALASEMQLRAGRLLNFINQVEEQGQAAKMLEQISSVSSHVPGMSRLKIGQLVRTLARMEAGEIPQIHSKALERLLRGIEMAARGVSRGAGMGSMLDSQIRPSPYPQANNNGASPEASSDDEYDAVDEDPFGLGLETGDMGPASPEDNEGDLFGAEDPARAPADTETLREDGEYDAVDADPFGVGADPGGSEERVDPALLDEEDLFY